MLGTLTSLLAAGGLAFAQSAQSSAPALPIPGTPLMAEPGPLPTRPLFGRGPDATTRPGGSGLRQVSAEQLLPPAETRPAPPAAPAATPADLPALPIPGTPMLSDAPLTFPARQDKTPRPSDKAVRRVSAEQHLPPADAARPTQPASPPVAPPAVGTPMWNDPAGECCTTDLCERKVCQPKGYVWASADYLLWWLKGDSTGPLVTTGPASVGPANFGVIGSPGTRVLFGDSGLDYGTFNGMRATVGIIGPEHAFGIEGTGFLLERRTIGLGIASGANGSPIIARPFIDATVPQAGRLLTSADGAFAGQLIVGAHNRFWGGEASITRAVCGTMSCDKYSTFEIDLLAGFRYLDLAERLDIAQRSQLLPDGTATYLGNQVFPGAIISVADSIASRTKFFGAQLGAQAELQHGKFFALAVAKVGIGLNRQVISLNGSSMLEVAGAAAQPGAGGLLVLPSNAGERSNDDVGVVPEVALNLGYQVHRNIRVYMGYTYLYWNQVVRPGDQVNPVLDPRQLPTSVSFVPGSGATQPAPTFIKTDFWAHGLNIGLAVHF